MAKSSFSLFATETTASAREVALLVNEGASHTLEFVRQIVAPAAGYAPTAEHIIAARKVEHPRQPPSAYAARAKDGATGQGRHSEIARPMIHSRSSCENPISSVNIVTA
jgi:hypothetical protein